MKLNILLILIPIFLMNSCSTKTEDQKFKELTEQFFKDYFKSRPMDATWIGVHDYDHLLNDISQQGLIEEVNRSKEYKRKLMGIDSKKLSEENNIDYRMLLENLDETIFYLEELREYEWNPIFYTEALGTAMTTLLSQDFAPINSRLESFYKRMGEIPKYLERAKGNFKNASKIHVETAIKQNNGNISVFKEEMHRYFEGANPTIVEKIKARSDTTIKALENFGKWMETELLPNANKDFRIGKDLYYKKLTHSLKLNLTPEELLERAEKEKVNIQNEMFELALPLYKEWFRKSNVSPNTMDEKFKITRAVLDKITENRPQEGKVVEVVTEHVKRIEAFVKEKDLITLDQSQPLEIRIMPEYLQGVAVASLESPGPLEKKLKSFYNVSPDIKGESYLREYNNFSLQVLTIHEAIPGHYVQLYYSNRYPSLIRGVFGSGPMIEGWAVYTERMMIENGYGDNDPRIKLIQRKWYLRAIANAIIDHKIHAGQMTEQEALDLMIRETFQEESEAKGKWRRANLTSAQLSTYFAGVSEILRLREDYKTKMSDKYSVKEFNEKFISYGSPSIKYLREILLKFDNNKM